ncbi:probable serine/threonine-protein kinase fnkB [Penaeus japonicus]|uniref:probable serine/threonine-protein kinase fnkB n=1 Tax=Penaeus japonicus TaxID=27405 RepID=UPI001C713631|nr:probable serine/threonine-protein kinase fnkB [Penaeus japonicus]
MNAPEVDIPEVDIPEVDAHEETSPEFVEIALKIAKTFGGIHQSGVVHNDIKWDNLCLQFTTKGLKVTLIDFGIAKDYGMTMSLEGEWIPEGCYPPEFYKDFGGECCHESDVYAIGGLMQTICKRADLQNPKILEWIRKSKSQVIEERENLNVLLKLLRAEKSEQLIVGNSTDIGNAAGGP